MPRSTDQLFVDTRDDLQEMNDFDEGWAVDLHKLLSEVSRCHDETCKVATCCCSRPAAN